MNSQILHEAIKIIPDSQVLINMVSQRVRQLSAGSKAMVEVMPSMDYADIALTEIVNAKLNFSPAPQAPEPQE